MSGDVLGPFDDGKQLAVTVPAHGCPPWRATLGWRSFETSLYRG